MPAGKGQRGLVGTDQEQRKIADVRVLRQEFPLLGPYLAPRTPTEDTLAGIFCNALGMDKISINDDFEELGGDPQEPKQLDAAVAVAIRTMVAFARHVPHPFGGPAEVIISHDRSAAFLHPRMPWAKVLFGSRLVHVVPWSHREMFRSGRRSVARLIKSALEEEPVPETVLERRMPSALTNA
jgi:hypothetical protein